jgi:hypothetical protein
VRKVVLGSLLLIVCVLSARFILSQRPTQRPPFVAPSNWKEIDLGHFLFYLPPDMKPVSVRGIDSDVWQYSNSSIRLTIDWGPYQGAFEPYRNQPEYKEEWIKVGGKTAHYWSFRFGEDHTAAVLDGKRHEETICFADTETKRMNLTFNADCQTKSDQETAKMIFQSIRFK